MTGNPSDWSFPSYEEWLKAERAACPTEWKRWAQIYFRIFRHWPRRVVDERMAWTASLRWWR